MRAIVISDCHANVDYVVNALLHSRYDQKKDRLIFAGDVFDIGPDPKTCLDFLEDAGAEMLLGNHELAVLYGERISPQSLISWTFKDFIKSKVRGPERWAVMAEHDGVLISHAGVSQVYWETLEGMSAEEVAAYFNDRFQHIDIKAIADEFWSQEGPLWFRPGFLCPLQGFKQIVGHTPPSHLLPEFAKSETYISVDPYVRHPSVASGKRYRYVVIEDGIVSVYDSLIKNSTPVA